MNISPLNGGFNTQNLLSSPNNPVGFQAGSNQATFLEQDTTEIGELPAPIINDGEPDPPPPSIANATGENLVGGSSGLASLDLLA